MWNDRYTRSFFASVLHDPATMTVLSIGSAVAGTAISAGSTLAGGAAARTLGDYTGKQLDANAMSERAVGQRQGMERDLTTQLAISSARARAAGGGVSTTTGSAEDAVEQLAKRGKYQALTDVWQGENAAAGLETKASAARFEGEQKKKQAGLAALGTLAGGAGSIFKQYGDVKYGPNRWQF